MDLIFTNKNREDVGVLHNYEFDLAFGTDENNFECVVGQNDHHCEFGSFLYIEGTEYGGIVDSITSKNSTKEVVYSGRTWHGIMNSKVLQPDDGQAYLTVTGEVNSVVASLVARMGLSDLFEVSTENSGLTIKNYKMNRYINGYDGILKMLKTVGGKLLFRVQNDCQVLLSVVPAVDYTKEELDSDLLDLDVTQTKNTVNHLICLGSGELENRTVIHLYADASGKISQTQTFTGSEEYVAVFDYPNAVDESELIKEGTDRLKELLQQNDISVDVNDVDDPYDIGDLVGASDSVTNLNITVPVAKKIVTIRNGTVTIDIKTETGNISKQSSGGYVGGGGSGEPGQPGEPGKDGEDGVSCTHEWNGTVLTITSASGTSSADLKGEQGNPGKNGSDGKSAYESAKSGGYTGAEEQFNTDLSQVSGKVSMAIVKGQGSEMLRIENALVDCIESAVFYGKTVQNGTPSVAAPLELNSPGGNGDCHMYVNSILYQLTSPGAYGVKTTEASGASNFVDSTGQHWITDEVDFARGVFVKRTHKTVFNGTENWMYVTNERTPCFRIQLPKRARAAVASEFMFSHWVSAPFCYASPTPPLDVAGTESSQGYLYKPVDNFASLDEFKAWLAVNPVTMVYAMYTPEETVLSAEQMAVFESITNDGGAVEITTAIPAMLKLSDFATTNHVAKIVSLLKADDLTFADGETFQEKYDSGELKGEQGEPGKDGYTPVKGVDYFDGADGSPGADGKDGVSVTHRWEGTTLVVTSASGTSSADLKGEKGDPGEGGGGSGVTVLTEEPDATDIDEGEVCAVFRDGKTVVLGADFEQPVLTANGILGGSAFAVSASNEFSAEYALWNAFGASESAVYSSSVNPATTPITLTFYNPDAICLASLSVKNVPSNLSSSSPKMFTIKGSNDNSSWTTLGAFTNTNNTNGATWSVAVDTTDAYKYFAIVITSANTSQAFCNIGKISIEVRTTIETTTAVGLFTKLEGEKNGQMFEAMTVSEIRAICK